MNIYFVLRRRIPTPDEPMPRWEKIDESDSDNTAYFLTARDRSDQRPGDITTYVSVDYISDITRHAHCVWVVRDDGRKAHSHLGGYGSLHSLEESNILSFIEIARNVGKKKLIGALTECCFHGEAADPKLREEIQILRDWAHGKREIPSSSTFGQDPEIIALNHLFSMIRSNGQPSTAEILRLAVTASEISGVNGRRELTDVYRVFRQNIPTHLILWGMGYYCEGVLRGSSVE